MKYYIYINGINTSITEGYTQANRLSNMVGHPVSLYHNESDSSITAIIESGYNRWLGFWLEPTRISQRLTHRLSKRIENEAIDEIIIFAHSQGTAIAATALRNLLKEPYCMFPNKVKCIFFAPVNGVAPKCEYLEYFINDFDYVVKALPGTYIKKATAFIKNLFIPKKKGYKKVFTRYDWGHSLIDSYISKIKLFRNYQDSLFWELQKEPEMNTEGEPE